MTKIQTAFMIIQFNEITELHNQHTTRNNNGKVDKMDMDILK